MNYPIRMRVVKTGEPVDVYNINNNLQSNALPTVLVWWNARWEIMKLSRLMPEDAWLRKQEREEEVKRKEEAKHKPEYRDYVALEDGIKETIYPDGSVEYEFVV